MPIDPKKVHWWTEHHRRLGEESLLIEITDHSMLLSCRNEGSSANTFVCTRKRAKEIAEWLLAATSP